jgi:hypothetical protein
MMSEGSAKKRHPVQQVIFSDSKYHYVNSVCYIRIGRSGNRQYSVRCRSRIGEQGYQIRHVLLSTEHTV